MNYPIITYISAGPGVPSESYIETIKYEDCDLFVTTLYLYGIEEHIEDSDSEEESIKIHERFVKKYS